MSPCSGSTFIKEIEPLNFSLYSSNGTSIIPPSPAMGTLNRVPAITYSVLLVGYGEQWLPELFGISKISTVLNVFKSILATLGVLLAFTNSQRPSAIPSVRDNLG